MTKEKTAIRQDDKFIYYDDNSKETLDDYRKKKNLPPRSKLKELEMENYRKANRVWLKNKAAGKATTLHDI